MLLPLCPLPTTPLFAFSRCFRAAACLFRGGQVGEHLEWVAWGVVDGSWSASGPRDHCEAASAAASRLPPATTPPIACRLPPVPLDTACDLLGLPDRPPPRLRACVPIADRRPPTAARRAPPAASDLPARQPACVPACSPAAVVGGGLCVVSAGSRGWRVVTMGVWGGARGGGLGCGGEGLSGAGANSVVSGTGLVSA